MNCTICGQATLPGAMLCRPCKAALKRARYLSVQDLPRASILRPRRGKGVRRGTASGTATGTPPGTAAPAAPVATFVPAPPARTAALRPLLAGVAAITVLAVVAYVGQRQMTASATDAAPAASSRETPVVLAPLPAPEPAPVVLPAGSPAPSVTLAPPPEPAPAVAPPPAPRPRVTTPPRAEPTPLPPPVRIEVAEPAPPVPVAVAPPPPPVARPAPPPDRWQSMSNALAQCAREGGFSGIVCDQRVRLASCEGYWGRVPQCPLPPENPGGQ